MEAFPQIEAQITNEETLGGIQFEVVPERLPPADQFFMIRILIAVNDKKRLFELQVLPTYTIREVASLIEEHHNMDIRTFRLYFDGDRLDVFGHFNLNDYEIEPGDFIEVYREQVGGGSLKRVPIGVAIGRLIRQTVRIDNNPSSIWESDAGTNFNVQIVNSTSFSEITGLPAPSTPITATAYAAFRGPYFSIHNEQSSGIKGDWKDVKSVNEID